MTLEERLAEHLQASGDAIQPPPSGVDALRAVSTARYWRTGVAGVFGVLGLGAIAYFMVGAGEGPGLASASDDRPVRVVVSPFVELRNRVAEQADEELFTVTASEPQYWRIATLHQYEDGIWKLNADFDQIGEKSFSSTGSNGSGDNPSMSQQISITGLDSIWLPVATEPFRITLDDASEVDGQRGPDGELRRDPTIELDAGGATLAIASDFATSDGLVYTAQSAPVVATPELLRKAPETIPTAIAVRYLGVDDERYPQLLSDLAVAVAADSETRYDKVLAIQNHLRGFTSESGSSEFAEDPIVQMLQEEVGSAQQFAGVFVMMARELGIPARVAVGFTWGEPQAADGDTVDYVVSGRHAHAWPEIYFYAVGWVPFEPTPGRGMPGATDYTGVEPSQAS